MGGRDRVAFSGSCRGDQIGRLIPPLSQHKYCRGEIFLLWCMVSWKERGGSEREASRGAVTLFTFSTAIGHPVTECR